MEISKSGYCTYLSFTDRSRLQTREDRAIVLAGSAKKSRIACFPRNGRFHLADSDEWTLHPFKRKVSRTSSW